MAVAGSGVGVGKSGRGCPWFVGEMSSVAAGVDVAVVGAGVMGVMAEGVGVTVTAVSRSVGTQAASASKTT